VHLLPKFSQYQVHHDYGFSAGNLLSAPNLQQAVKLLQLSVLESFYKKRQLETADDAPYK